MSAWKNGGVYTVGLLTKRLPSLVLKPAMMSTFGLTMAADLRAATGSAGRTKPSRTAAKKRPKGLLLLGLAIWLATARRAEAGRARAQVRLPGGQPSVLKRKPWSWSASCAVTRYGSAVTALGHQPRTPDCSTARRKRPSEERIMSCAETDHEPADSPKIITRVGSPPKLAMFAWTHLRASCWSWNPKMPPLKPGWPVKRKLRGGNRAARRV